MLNINTKKQINHKSKNLLLVKLP